MRLLRDCARFGPSGVLKMRPSPCCRRGSSFGPGTWPQILARPRSPHYWGTSVWPEFGARNRARNWSHVLGLEMGPPCCRRWPHVRTGPGPGVQCLVGKGGGGRPHLTDQCSTILASCVTRKGDSIFARPGGSKLTFVLIRCGQMHNFRSKNTVLGEVIGTSVC